MGALPALVGNNRLYIGGGCWLIFTYQEIGLLTLRSTWYTGAPSIRRVSRLILIPPVWRVLGRMSNEMETKCIIKCIMILCVDHYHVYSELDQMSPYDQIFVKKSLSASEGAFEINCLSSLMLINGRVHCKCDNDQHRESLYTL